ncbi:Voltage-dependent T-type calcium channel subunit alpha-1I [Anabarilius grahami]|uniref:Voltage-dependent T-type calcium channel subunit alpha-1I n=1 Tax=Anabarilius grahami TaxID=495550 RepID=A0A3N0Y4A4_ANAGA|nr:Voltage-dependent T-type calcium channel subunit alpha-1I [Anabarilius grahami]
MRRLWSVESYWSAQPRTSLTSNVMAVIDKPEGQSAHVSHKERMTTEELLGVSQVGARLRGDFRPSKIDDIIEEEDAGSENTTLDVPFPQLAPVVFSCLKQTTSPRSWSIKMVLSPYPLLAGAHRSGPVLEQQQGANQHRLLLPQRQVRSYSVVSSC